MHISGLIITSLDGTWLDLNLRSHFRGHSAFRFCDEGVFSKETSRVPGPGPGPFGK